MKDYKYIYTARPYTLLNDQLPYWKSEVDRFRALVDSLEVDRSLVIRKEKELSIKTESIDALRNPVDSVDFTIENLEQQLQQCINENNEMEIEMEEAVQDSGKVIYNNHNIILCKSHKSHILFVKIVDFSHYREKISLMSLRILSC